MKFIWDRYYGHSYRALISAKHKRRLYGRMKQMFISLDHSKPLHIKTQSLFIALWANIKMKYAFNYLLMDRYCTQINIFSVTVFMKVLSTARYAYYYRCIKQIWNAILQNDALLDAILNYGARNLVSYSVLTLAASDPELDTALALLNAANGSRQMFMYKSLTAVLKRIHDVPDKSAYKWAIRLIWHLSVSNLFDYSYEPKYRQDFVQLISRTNAFL